MICKMCATGSDMQARANEIDAHRAVESQFSISKLRKFGVRLHRFCSGPGHCDCQHKEVKDVREQGMPSKKVSPGVSIHPVAGDLGKTTFNAEDH